MYLLKLVDLSLPTAFHSLHRTLKVFLLSWVLQRILYFTVLYEHYCNMVDDHNCPFSGKMAGIDKKLTRSLEQEVTVHCWCHGCLLKDICCFFYDAKISSCQSDSLCWTVVIQYSNCMMKLAA